MHGVRRAFVHVLLAAACGCSSASPRPSPVRPPSEPPVASASSLAASAPAASGAPAVVPPVAPASLGFSFTRVDATPVVSIAVGKPPKIALLAAGEALIGDGRAPFVRVPAPDTTSEPIEIFFGRDDQPRLMGHRRRDSKLEPYYRRYKGGRFQPEPSELGPLAAPDGALYGVLGHADPEVVCLPTRFCLVKRTTGWRRAPAHSEPVRVVLGGGTAYALHRDRIERLDGDAWVPIAPARAFQRPVSLFVDGGGATWVVEGGSEAVLRSLGERWETLPSPVREPRAVAGNAANDVWLVGASGAAHFDGRTWSVVPGVTGPLSLIALAPPNLWLAGEAGVFMGRPSSP